MSKFLLNAGYTAILHRKIPATVLVEVDDRGGYSFKIRIAKEDMPRWYNEQASEGSYYHVQPMWNFWLVANYTPKRQTDKAVNTLEGLLRPKGFNGRSRTAVCTLDWREYFLQFRGEPDWIFRLEHISLSLSGYNVSRSLAATDGRHQTAHRELPDGFPD